MFVFAQLPVRWLLAMSLVTLTVVCAEEPTAEVHFANPVVLVNKSITVTVAPEVGRIISFAPKDGANVLWVSSAETATRVAREQRWVNYGGDKIWPALHGMWQRYLPHGKPWPPDSTLDGSSWEVLHQDERQLVMRSPLATGLGIRITRSITVDPQQPRVVIRNRIQREQGSVFPVHIWAISQIRPPRYALLHVAQTWPQGPQGKELYALWARGEDDNVSAQVTPLAHKQALHWDLAQQDQGKLGTLGTWGAAVYDDWLLVHQTAFDPHGSYPDASNIQVYVQGDYVELETLSPQQHPQPGEAVTNTVIWTLLPVNDQTPADLVPRIKALPAP